MDKYRYLLDWILHPIANMKELDEYRQDYEKISLSYQNNLKKLINKNLKLKNEVEKCKEVNEKNKVNHTRMIKDLYKIIDNKQKSINKLKGQLGSSKRKIYKLERKIALIK